MQELQKIRRGQQELFLTDLPMHIVLAIDECCDSEGSSEFLVYRLTSSVACAIQLISE